MIKEESIESRSPAKLNLVWSTLAVSVLLLMSWVGMFLSICRTMAWIFLDDPVRAPQGGRVSHTASNGIPARSAYKEAIT